MLGIYIKPRGGIRYRLLPFFYNNNEIKKVKIINYNIEHNTIV